MNRKYNIVITVQIRHSMEMTVKYVENVWKMVCANKFSDAKFDCN